MVDSSGEKSFWDLMTEPSPLHLREVRVLCRALEERWPMSAEAREEVIGQLQTVLLDPASRPRAFSRAVRALRGTSRLDVDAIAAALDAPAREALKERLAALGIPHEPGTDR
jgi:hypothetical protein